MAMDGRDAGRVLPAGAGAAALAAGVVFAATAPASGDPGAPAHAAATTRVSVRLSEFRIAPAPATIAHGRVTFSARNAGDVEHELVIIRTSRPASRIPTTASGKASERGAVGKVEELDAGRRGSVTVTLRKGHYVLLCNVASHYAAGMRRTFTVT